MSQPTIINGCPVIWERDGYSIIEHPNAGFMLYRTARLGIFRTLRGAIRNAERRIEAAS